MSTELINPKTNTLQSTPVQLAFLGAMHRCSFDGFDDMQDKLQGYLKQHLCQSLDAKLSSSQENALNAIAIGLGAAIEAKSQLMALPIYDEGFVHSDKISLNLSITLNEVARDLCSSVKVLCFRPIYGDCEFSEPCDTEQHIDSLIEIEACGKSYIAALFDHQFYANYAPIPNAYHEHTLIGRKDNPNHPTSYKLDVMATNPLVLNTLKRLCIHEVDKCMDEHIYRIASKNERLTAIAHKVTALSRVDFDTALLVSSKIERAALVDGKEHKALVSVLEREFSDHKTSSTSIKDLLDLFTNALNENPSTYDFSALPFGVKGLEYVAAPQAV